MKPLGKIGRIAALLALAGSAWGQTAVPPAAASPTQSLVPVTPSGDLLPAPLPFPTVTPYAVSPPSVSETTNAVVAAERGRSALANGLAKPAVVFFLEALSQPGLSQEARDGLYLELATAYLAEADVSPEATAKAAAALKAVEAATNTPAYLLRDVLLKERGGQWAEAGPQLARITAAQLPLADQPWYYLAQAIFSEWSKDAAGASVAWNLAISKATPLQAAQFEAALWRGQILLGQQATPEARDKLQQQMDAAAADPATNTQYALDLAIVLDKLGARDAAKKLISDKLRRVDLDKLSRYNLRLEYVLLDQEGPVDAAPVPGDTDQDKLQTILQDWPEKDAPDHEKLVQMQAIALGLLADSHLTLNPKGLKEVIDALVLDPRGHPLLKQLYLLQTQLDLDLQFYKEAATAAQNLLAMPRETPRDPAREGAWLTLAMVAWSASPRQYLEAAKNLNSLLTELPPDDPGRRKFTATLADLYFLNGDQSGDQTYYLRAAEFYSTLITDPPPEEQLGPLLERAVESELRAGRLDEALARLDQVASRLDPDAEARWRAECNVLLALRNSGRGAEAFQRLSRLLDNAHIDKWQIDLRLRLRWLDAALAGSVQDPTAMDKAHVLQDEAEAALKLGGSREEMALRTELAANGLLLQMQAASRVAQAAAAKAAQANPAADDKQKLAAAQADEERFFNDLQNKYRDTDAGIFGVLFFAEDLAGNNLLVQAKDKLNELADRFEDPAKRQNPGAEYAPRARYEAALYAEASDATGTYQEAMDILKKFAASYRDDPLYFQVLIKQGELLVKLKQFDLAFDVYDTLANMLIKGQGRPLRDELVASTLMARADCLITISGLDSENKEKRKAALSELGVLVNQTELPIWTRVEAGYKHAKLQAVDDPDKALAAYWQVINDFLLKAGMMAELDKGPDGRKYMASCFYELGNLYENQKDYASARKVYEMAKGLNLMPELFDKRIRDLASAPAATVAPSPAPATIPAPAPASSSAPASGGSPGN